MIGPVVAMALVFAKVVLGVAWTGKSKGGVSTALVGNYNNTIQNLHETADHKRNASIHSAAAQKLTASKSPKANKIDLLLNKCVYTCDNLVIGSIGSVFNGMLIILDSVSKNIKYEIPIYYIRQNLQNHVIMDISSNDLEHYTYLIVSRQNRQL